MNDEAESVDLDLIDDDSRRCEICDNKYSEGYGGTCDECDIWICKNCWPDHISDPNHP